MNEKALRVRYQKNKVKKERWKMYDVIIIGAGVSGAAAARELSRYNAKVCVIEKEEDVCCGTSKANSAIVHAGYDAKEGSLMAKLNVRGNALMEQLSKDLDFPFKRIGSLVVCKDEEDMSNLKALYDRGVANGVPGLRILLKEEVHEMEPNLSDDIYAALYAPSAGIVCPFHLNIALAENANANGVEFKFDTEVTDLKKTGEIWEVHTNQGDGLHGVGDACRFHPGLNEGQRLHGGSARLQIHVDDHGITGLVQQLLFDQIHMGNLGYLLLDVAVILDIDAAFGDHGGNSLGIVGIGLGHGQADICPFHKKEPPWVLCFYL